MANYGVLNWFYSDTGNWLTMSSTDFDSIQNLTSEICKLLSRQANVKFRQFTSGGGAVRIDNIIVESKIRDHIEDLVDIILRRNDWKQMNNSYEYKRTA